LPQHVAPHREVRRIDGADCRPVEQSITRPILMATIPGDTEAVPQLVHDDAY
jgi:hypothetical protein